MVRGFTLIELLLTIALLTIIAGLSVPLYFSFQQKNDIDVTATTIAQSLRRAQMRAQAVDGDSTWGVSIASSTLTIFQGNSYATRVVTADETIALPAAVIPSGLTEIIFSKLFGLPSAVGTTTVYVSSSNETRYIAITAKGTISY